MPVTADGRAIEVENLRKHYGSIKAVDGLGFSVDAGEIFGMLGPNGAGKTTTVEILIGIRKRDGGLVKVLGADPEHDPRAVKSRIGVQLQTSSMYPRLTVREVVRLFASFFSASLPEETVIEQVGLQEKSGTMVKDLSGGQAQRLAVAIAMVNDGDLIFLDEPTTGLDPQARRNLWDLILDLKRNGKTVFLTTHYMDEAEKLCDRVAVVDHGHIIALGSPQQLIKDNFQESALEFVQPALAGDPRLKELPGVARIQREDDCVTLYSTEVSRTVTSLMELATSTGAPIEDFSVRQATLEDVFLKLTGRRMRE